MNPTDTEHLDDVRARLEARGLLRRAGDAGGIRLPDLGAPTIVLPDAGDGQVSSDAIVVARTPVVVVACPACSTTRHLGVNRTGFECAGCGEAWRWAICAECDRLALTSERQDSWRCRGCDGLSRSWWRTTLPTDEPARVIRRRTEQLARHVHGFAIEKRQAGSRRRAVRLGAVAAVLATALGGLAILRSASEVGAGSSCGRFDRIAAAVQTGRLDGAPLRAELRALAASTGDDGPLRAAALAMAAAPTPMSMEFAVARTQFEDACRGG